MKRDLERGKPLFRRKGGKTRYLDGSGHKGLADSCGAQDSHLPSSRSVNVSSCRGKKTHETCDLECALGYTGVKKGWLRDPGCSPRSFGSL